MFWLWFPLPQLLPFSSAPTSRFIPFLLQKDVIYSKWKITTLFPDHRLCASCTSVLCVVSCRIWLDSYSSWFLCSVASLIYLWETRLPDNHRMGLEDAPGDKVLSLETWRSEFSLQSPHKIAGCVSSLSNPIVRLYHRRITGAYYLVLMWAPGQGKTLSLKTWWKAWPLTSTGTGSNLFTTPTHTEKASKDMVGGGIFYNVCCRNTLKALKATLFCYQPVSSGRSSNWSFTLGSATLLLASAVGSLFTKFSVIFLFLQSLLLGMYTEHGSAETGDLAVTERSFANT